MEKHMSDHDHDGTATCWICSCQTKSEDELTKHILIAHKVFKCTQCDLSLKNKQDITTHMK